MKAKKQKLKKVQWKKQKMLPQIGGRGLIIGAVWESIAILILFFAAISILGMFSSNVEIGVNGGLLLIVLVFGTVFFYEVLVTRFLNRAEGKKKLFLRIGSKVLPAIAFGMIFLKYQADYETELEGGFRMFTKYYYRAYDYLFKTTHVVRDAPVDWIPIFIGFLATFVFLALYLLSWIGRRKWLMLLVPASTLSLIMYAGLAPKFGHILAMALGLFMIYKSHRRSEEAYVGVTYVFGVLLVLLLLIGHIFGNSADKLLENSLQAKAYEEIIEQDVKNIFSSLHLVKKQTINNARPEYDDKKILTMRADKLPQGNLYLQEFYGESYEDNMWTFSKKDFSQACAEHGISEQQAAMELASSVFRRYYGDLRGYYEALLGVPFGYEGDDLFKKYEVMDYQTDYQSLLNSTMLIPYGMDVQGISGIKFMRDAIAQKGGFKRSITYQGWDTNEFDFGSLAFSGTLEDDDVQFWEWYNEYVKEHYLEYPQYVKKSPVFDYAEAMVDGEKHYGITENELRYLTALAVQSILTGPNSTYTWDLDELESGEDPIKHFLENTRRGYCIHYASVGVMLLRSLGVPARYASGYVVKPASFVLQEDGSCVAEVIDRNGHAWAEVYYDGIGWVPIEMTPGYATTSGDVPTFQQPKEEKTNVTIDPIASKEPASSEETSEETPGPEETEAPEETSDAEESSEQADDEELGAGFGKGSGDGARNGTFRIVIVFAGIAIVGLVLTIVGRKVMSDVRLERAMVGKYYKTATLMINRKVYHKVKGKGKTVKKARTDKEFEMALTEVLGAEQTSEVAKYMQIVRAAAFSKEIISKSDCLFAWHIYKDLKEK